MIRRLVDMHVTSGDLDAWHSGRVTKELWRALEEEKARALRALLDKARTSSDPSVARAVAKLDTIEETQEAMRDRKKDQ
jgi:hypothetical protein